MPTIGLDENLTLGPSLFPHTQSAAEHSEIHLPILCRRGFANNLQDLGSKTGWSCAIGTVCQICKAAQVLENKKTFFLKGKSSRFLTWVHLPGASHSWWWTLWHEAQPQKEDMWQGDCWKWIAQFVPRVNAKFCRVSLFFYPSLKDVLLAEFFNLK